MSYDPILGNSPPSLHEGMTYMECLTRLGEELGTYGGEFVPPTMGDGEHPLHFAVRLVESFQRPGSRYGPRTWRRLPLPAWEYWGDVLKNSRHGMVDVGRLRPRYKDYGEPNPKAAVAAAHRLADWVVGELGRSFVSDFGS